MKAENITYHESTESYAEPLKKVTMENANEFLDMKRNGSKVVANATSMCISSPILLIVLVTMAEDGVFHVSESLATVFGCVFLLVLNGHVAIRALQSAPSIDNITNQNFTKFTFNRFFSLR